MAASLPCTCAARSPPSTPPHTSLYQPPASASSRPPQIQRRDWHCSACGAERDVTAIEEQLCGVLQQVRQFYLHCSAQLCPSAHPLSRVLSALPLPPKPSTRRKTAPTLSLHLPTPHLCLPDPLHDPPCPHAILPLQAADGYQLQDLRCMKCASVATNHLQQSCDVCGGHLRGTQPPVGGAAPRLGLLRHLHMLGCGARHCRAAARPPRRPILPPP